MRFLAILAIGLLAGAGAGALAAGEHPRLLMSAGAEEKIEARAATDPLFSKVKDQVLTRATGILGERTCRYDIPDGRRLLGESRRARQNILHTAMAWRLTGEARFRDRCLRELDAACAMPDWNPSHFLDVGEMAGAVAVGYDWLHAELGDERRRRVRRALIDLALIPGARAFEKEYWWTRATNNWGQVCASGLVLAAVVLEEDEPERARRIRRGAEAVMAKSLDFYSPDGVYPEGPGYWGYGTDYHVVWLAQCQSQGLEASVSQAMLKSVDFLAQVTGPSGVPFNFADGRAGWLAPSPAWGWLAARRGPQAVTLFRSRLAEALETGRAGGGAFPLHLLWLPAEPEGSATEPPLAMGFSGVQPVAAFRSGWGTEDAWLAIKGGTPRVSHGQMDVGAFVFEAHGVRWSHDLGADNYNLPGYFQGRRWEYFRLRNHSHSTLVIAGGDQAADAEPSPLVSFQGPEESPLGPWEAVLDMTRAYANQAEAVTRTVSFDPRGSAEISDKVTGAQGEVRWGMVTKAKAKLEGGFAVLRSKGKELRVVCVEPAGSAWKLESLHPGDDKQNPNKHSRLLAVTAPKAKAITLRVRLEWR